MLFWVLLVSLSFLLIYVGIRPVLYPFKAERRHISLGPDYASFREWIEPEVDRIKKELILTSEGIPAKAYKRVAEIIENKKKKNASLKVRILTTPEGLAKDEENMIKKLAFQGEPIIDIRLIPKEDFPRKHIKIFDDNRLWVEDPHDDEQNYREGWWYENSVFLVARYKKEFMNYWARAEKPAL